jgi:hypothetical protein
VAYFFAKINFFYAKALILERNITFAFRNRTQDTNLC